MQNRFVSYFNTAKTLIINYNGNEPLTIYLKKYFAAYKKHGSTDRKQIAHWCYCYYRLGNALRQIDIELRMKIAYFLCNNNLDKYTTIYNENYIENASSATAPKIVFIQKQFEDFTIENIFSQYDSISSEINKENFVANFLQQQNLFLRIRPNYKQAVLLQLQQHNICYELINDICICLANTTSIESVLQLNQQVVVQDYASQQVAYFFGIVKKQSQHPQLSVWDCCAASGGKSILAKDVLTSIALTVSDVRSSILANLKTRFSQARITQYNSFVGNLTQPLNSNKKYDVIIADVPCTGSGTWARTPEQLHFFAKEKIESFAILQQQIAMNVLQQLQPKGYLLYITCSIFSRENEDVVNYILQNTSLQLLEKKYFEGSMYKADTMFAALLQAI